MEQPAGSRGSEGMKVMSVEDQHMLSFTWNAPPSIPDIRGQRTLVIITFSANGPENTDIYFRNVGYGRGESWRRSFDYFTRAWGEIVLPRFRYVLERGTFDWENMPDFSDFTLV